MRTTNCLVLRSLLFGSAVVSLSLTAAAQPAPAVPPPAPAPLPPEAAAPLPPQAAAAPEPVPVAPPPAAAPVEVPPPSAIPSPYDVGPPAPPALPPPPAADKPATPDPITLKIAGSLWTRYELRSNYAEHGLTHARLHREGDYLVSRARLALKTSPVDIQGVKVSGTFAPQAAYTMGENTGPNPTVSDHPALALYEGYASVGTARYQVDGGRFSMSYGDSVVIGDLGWNEAARAFNGARIRLSPAENPMFIDGFATIITEGRLTTLEPVEGDTYFYGIYAGLGPLFAKDFDLDVYLLGQSTAGSESVRLDPMNPATTGDLDSATEITFGARVKGKAGILDYRAEGGIQGGARPVAPTVMAPAPPNRSKFAGQIVGELGVAPVKGLRVGLEGLYATGDDLSTTDKDEGYNELYPTSHRWLGLMDVIGPRTNTASVVLHLSFAATEALKLTLDAHHFSRPQKNAGGKDGSVGQEIDANVAYAIGGGASVRGLYGAFLPNEDYWTSNTVSANDAGEAMHYVEIQFGYDFK